MKNDGLNNSNYDDFIDDRIIGMYKILETSILSENKIMQMAIKHGQKKLAKKAAKEQKRKQAMIGEYLSISEKELPSYENEINALVNYIKSLLKKEIPNCSFNNQELKHTKSVIDSQHIIHKYYIRLFEMNDDNFKKFISKSKDNNLKSAENTWDYVDELIADTDKRIVKPIEAKGFKDDGQGLLSKSKDGKEYLNVDLGDEATIDIVISMEVIVKK